MKYFWLIIFSCLIVSPCHADEDIFNDYNTDITSDAQAKNINMDIARSDNLTYRIKHNISNGIIITNNEKNNFNGFGNVKIEKGSNIGTIVVDTDMGKNNNIIFMNNQDRSNF